VALFSLLSFGDILGYGLTGCDTLTLIETGQINSLADVRRTFSSSLMEGTSFANTFRYYRPLSSLTYAVDFAIWGLEPFGYHLHNLVVHTLNGFLVWWLARLITGRSSIAVLAACLFVSHPMLIETVPGIPRRQDLWATAFTLLALLANVKANAGAHRVGMTAVGCVCLALGLMTKESAALIIPHIIAYNYCFSERDTKRLASALRGVLPYLATAIPFIVWRSFILDGFGGTWRQTFGSDPLHIFLEFAEALFSPIPLVFPGFGFPLLLVGLTAAGLFPFRSHIGDWLTSGPTGRTTLFSALLLVNSLALYVATAVFGPWMAYSAAIPYCMGLACALVGGGQWLVASTNEPRWRMATGGATLLFWLALLVYQYSYSPIFVHYEGWEASAKLNQQILDQIDPYTAQFPDPGVLVIRRLPSRHFSGRDPTQVRSSAYLKNYSIKSYLNLKHPGNDVVVVVKDRYRPTQVPEFVTVVFARHSERRAVVLLGYPMSSPERQRPKRRPR
jgi:hypothetical protein